MSHRISIKDGKFRLITDGKQISVSESDTMNIVVIDAANLARSYYAEDYDPNDVKAPTCWSNDTQVPADEVPIEGRQSTRCMNCKQNIKGSGQQNSRACRYFQRLAVSIEGDFDNVYQLQLPATSIFGKPKDVSGKMMLQAYAKFLHNHKTPAIALVTEISFDENSEVPKLLFKAMRPLEEEELKLAVSLSKDDRTATAISFNPPKKAQPFVEVDGYIYKANA